MEKTFSEEERELRRVGVGVGMAEILGCDSWPTQCEVVSDEAALLQNPLQNH